MNHASTSTHPPVWSEPPAAEHDWSPDALAQRMFVFAMIMCLCVALAFVLVSAGRSF